MDTKSMNLGKIFLKAILRTLEDFLNIDEEVTEDFLNIKNEVSQEFLNIKKEKKIDSSIRRSKRKTRTPVRYGYDE